LTQKQFHFRFTNTMNDADGKAAYARYYVPGPGRVLFQAGFANFNPKAVVDYTEFAGLGSGGRLHARMGEPARGCRSLMAETPTTD
jgi:hypothetical protein